MTKLIALLMLVAVLYGGWKLFFYWEEVKNNEDLLKKQAAAQIVSGNQLEGMPQQLETSLDAAESHGADGLGAWLKTYGPSIHDPRKAWIELDYVLLLSRENPAEARRIFAEVKSRTTESSPIWPRLKKLEAAYE